MTTSTATTRLSRKLALAGVLGAAVLTAGAGLASASDRPGPAVETGYATVVDGEPAATDAADCADPTAAEEGDL